MTRRRGRAPAENRLEFEEFAQKPHGTRLAMGGAEMVASAVFRVSAADDGVSAGEVRRGLVQHLASLRAHALRLTKQSVEAHDLVQDTALRAMDFARSFEPGSNVRAWLHQVMDSVFISRYRRHARERRAHDTLLRDPCAWTRSEPSLPVASLSHRVRNALDELPQGFREVVVLVDVDELAYKDAAQRLGVPLGTVMSRLHRGRRLLASRLQDAETTLQAA